MIGTLQTKAPKTFEAMRAQVRRVVIEYQHTAYTMPGSQAAYGLACRVTFTAGVTVIGSDLGDVRTQLEADGLKLHGAKTTTLYQHGRYNPTWREVWTD